MDVGKHTVLTVLAMPLQEDSLEDTLLSHLVVWFVYLPVPSLPHEYCDTTCTGFVDVPSQYTSKHNALQPQQCENASLEFRLRRATRLHSEYER